MECFLSALLDAFPGRVAFVGIQGSWGRGEAGPDSDVDLVAVLDTLGPEELASCRDLLARMPFADRACGFFCDRAALAAWPAFDALQLRLDTRPLYGSLEPLLPPAGPEALCQAVRVGAANLYHAPATPPSSAPIRRPPSPLCKRLPSSSCGWRTTGAPANMWPPGWHCCPCYRSRSVPCWGRNAPFPP